MTDTDTMLDVGLDEWLAAPAVEPDWEPDGQADADRLLGVLRHIERQAAEDRATASARLADVNEWLEARQTALARRRERIERMLEGWARMRHAWSGGRELTWKLPNGELKLRVQDTRCEPDARKDEDAIGQTLMAAGWRDLVKVSHTLRKGDAKKLTQPGEPLPDYPAAEGYVAHEAIEMGGPDNDQPQVVPGVVLLVPMEERRFTAKPALVLPPELVR